MGGIGINFNLQGLHIAFGARILDPVDFLRYITSPRNKTGVAWT